MAMAQFIAGNMVCALIASIGEKRAEIEDVLSAFELQNPTGDSWYDEQMYVQVLRAIAQKMGPHWLFNIGKTMVEQGNIQAHNFDEALQYLDNAQGYYRLLSYNEDRKEAHVECRNPFPCYFDRGVLTSVFRNCQGNQIQSVHVALDNHRPSRLAGADVSYYTIMWQ
jgi:hypothetical protein